MLLTKTDSRKIHHLLPSSAGWETKMADYLSNVNPAGTVPVLVHNGHPVYESHEQILYIDRSGSALELETNLLREEGPY